MNILFVDYEYPPLGGGGGIVTQTVATALAEKGHRVFVVTMAGPNLPHFELKGNLWIIRVKSFRRSISYCPAWVLYLFPFMSFWCLYKICRQEKIDLINAHFVVPSALSASLVSLLTRVPLITSAFGADLYDPTRYKRQRFLLDMVCKFIFKLSSAITCPSTDMVERAKRLTSKPIVLVPHSVDTVRFSRSDSARMRKKLNLESTERRIIISLARLVPRKSFETALNAIKDVSHDIPSICYVIAGAGPDKERLVRIADDLGIAGNVVFAGRIDDEDLPAYYSMGEVFVLPSLHEAFGIVVLEAMACGTPVIASKFGGMLDIITEGVNGFLCDIGDAHCIAERLQQVLQNPDLYRRIADAAQDSMSRFSRDVVVEQYEKLYLDIVGERP